MNIKELRAWWGEKYQRNLILGHVWLQRRHVSTSTREMHCVTQWFCSINVFRIVTEGSVGESDVSNCLGRLAGPMSIFCNNKRTKHVT